MLHHLPYRLTFLQRRLYGLLIAAERRHEAGETAKPHWTATELGQRLNPPQDVKATSRALENLQMKLPLIPQRKYKVRSTIRRGRHPGTWWVERKRQAGEEQA